MDIKNAHQNFLREEIQMAAAAGDLERDNDVPLQYLLKHSNT
jgi:hypothetical protein